MKVKRHPWTGGTGRVIVEAVFEDTIIVQVESCAPHRRGEGLGVQIDAAIGSVSVGGAVEIHAAVAMTDAEARRLIREIEAALAK